MGLHWPFVAKMQKDAAHRFQIKNTFIQSKSLDFLEVSVSLS